MTELRHRCIGPVGTPWDCPACDAAEAEAIWREEHEYDNVADAAADLEASRLTAHERF